MSRQAQEQTNDGTGVSEERSTAPAMKMADHLRAEELRCEHQDDISQVAPVIAGSDVYHVRAKRDQFSEQLEPYQTSKVEARSVNGKCPQPLATPPGEVKHLEVELALQFRINQTLGDLRHSANRWRNGHKEEHPPLFMLKIHPFLSSCPDATTRLSLAKKLTLPPKSAATG